VACRGGRIFHAAAGGVAPERRRQASWGRDAGIGARWQCPAVRLCPAALIALPGRNTVQERQARQAAAREAAAAAREAAGSMLVSLYLGPVAAACV
jgi:hypothetical protein